MQELFFILIPRNYPTPKNFLLAKQKLHFNLTTDAASVLNWRPIDHRCSFTNCGKVICLRNRNYRHDLCPPLPTAPHYITVQVFDSKTETQTSDIHDTSLHNHENPPALTFRRRTPDVGGGGLGYYPSQPTEQLSSLLRCCSTHLEMPQTYKDTRTLSLPGQSYLTR